MSNDFDWLAQGDQEHVTKSYDYSGDAARAIKVVEDAVYLLGQACAAAAVAEEHAERNAVASVACFTRAYRQLRAAALLAHAGYYSEVGSLLRGVYEAAGTGQKLAKEPEEAERWLEKEEYWPEKKVRSRLNGLVETDEERQEAERQYAAFYRLASAEAHPTAASTLPLLSVSGGTISPRLETTFEQSQFENCLWRIAAVGTFACFAMRNAAVNERAIPPGWRALLHALQAQLVEAKGSGDEDLSHLKRDWEAEQRSFNEIVERTLRAEGIEERLRAHPLSWDNLNESGDD